MIHDSNNVMSSAVIIKSREDKQNYQDQHDNQTVLQDGTGNNQNPSSDNSTFDISSRQVDFNERTTKTGRSGSFISNRTVKTVTQTEYIQKLNKI